MGGLLPKVQGCRLWAWKSPRERASPAASADSAPWWNHLLGILSTRNSSGGSEQALALELEICIPWQDQLASWASRCEALLTVTQLDTTGPPRPLPAPCLLKD